MARADERPTWRIGELSRRVGVSDHLLRAWETRYGLLHPSRSPGGYRLYSQADADRIGRMQAHLAAGLSAAEAAQAVLAEGGASPVSGPGPAATPGLGVRVEVGELAGSLRQALDAFDEPTAQAVLDRLLAELSLATVLRDVVLPYLGELGERWQSGRASVAQEHFASFVIRGRLAGLARGWGGGRGPRAVLACPSLELHDLALMVFRIMLNRQGWRIDTSGPVRRSMSWPGPRMRRRRILSSSLPAHRTCSSPFVPRSPRSPRVSRSPSPARVFQRNSPDQSAPVTC